MTYDAGVMVRGGDVVTMDDAGTVVHDGAVVVPLAAGSSQSRNRLDGEAPSQAAENLP